MPQFSPDACTLTPDFGATGGARTGTFITQKRTTELFRPHESRETFLGASTNPGRVNRTRTYKVRANLPVYPDSFWRCRGLNCGKASASQKSPLGALPSHNGRKTTSNTKRSERIDASKSETLCDSPELLSIILTTAQLKGRIRFGRWRRT